MKKCRRGFTIIEVSLFLALSGMMMVGLMVGAGIAIAKQRYVDSVNFFAESLKNTYADIINVYNGSTVSSESGGTAGRTNQVIYGKALVIGDPDIEVDSNTGKRSTFYSYDIVGDIASSASVKSANTLSMLKELNPKVVKTSGSGASTTNSFYGESKIIIPWGAYLETPDEEDFKAVILIVRSPVSNSTHTYTYQANSISEINEFLTYTAAINAPGNNPNKVLTELLDHMISEGSSKYESSPVNICVQSPDNNNRPRRNVRIKPYASNSSSIELVALDGDDNACL